jgi:hypothetical protein
VQSAVVDAPGAKRAEVSAKHQTHFLESTSIFFFDISLYFMHTLL